MKGLLITVIVLQFVIIAVQKVTTDRYLNHIQYIERYYTKRINDLQS